MADKPDEFAVFMERFAKGDEEAATQLYERYHKALIIVIRHRLNRCPQLRALFESIDFEQAVWQEIVAHIERTSEFPTFESFRRYLAGIGRHKIATAQRKYLNAQKRDLRQHHHLSDRAVAAAATAVADPVPGPAEQAASQEAWVRWLLSLSQTQRQVVLMLRNGLSYQEMAEELGFSDRSIRRIVAELRGISPT